MNTAIICPSCGSTSQHSEQVPNRYMCSYCDTVFEHVSYIPRQQAACFSHDYLIELLNKANALDRKSNKYLTDSFAIRSQIPSLIEKIQDQDVIQQGIDCITSEIEAMKTDGYHYKGEYSLTSGEFPYTELHILSQYYLFLAQIYSCITYQGNDLHKAIEECDIALHIQEKYLGSIDRITKELKETLQKKL